MALLRPRRTRVGGGDQPAPGDQVGAAVVTIDHAFDQRWTSSVGERALDRLSELAAVGGAQPPTLPVLGVEDLDQPGVVPILDIVVWPVVDLDLDSVAVVVNQEDDDR